VRLKIDFDTRLVDLEAVQQGDMLELLKLFPLSGVELQLQQVACAPSSDEEPDGTALAAFLARTLHSWVRDITSSQLHHFFAGAGVMRPITSVGKTAANVILLPLEQYRRENGRVLYALRRGAMDFVKTVMVESLSATAALAHCFASGLSFLSEANPHSAQSLVSERPDGVHSGVASARSSLHRGVNTASHAIIAVPLDSYHRNGARGALKTTVRAIPVAVLAPVIGASEALSFTLLGIRNTMDPERRHDDDAKYKHGKNKASSSVL
jgi:autophagy-related protein 2